MNDITLSATNSSLILRKQPSASSLPVQASNGGKPQKAYLCNCKKTKCLKLYCDCFAHGEVCGPDCKCCECCNSIEQSKMRLEAIESILERQPEAFGPKLQAEKDNKLTHKKGCNCKKSNCLKKYCECYSAGIGCGPSCHCEDCKNGEHQEGFSRSKKLKLNDSSSISVESDIGVLESLETVSVQRKSFRKQSFSEIEATLSRGIPLKHSVSEPASFHAGNINTSMN